MESNGRRISSGGRASRGGQPRTLDQFLEEDAKTFASFLVGRRVDVTEKKPRKDDLRVKGIVRRPENSENKVRRSITCLCSCCIDVPSREQGSYHQQHAR